MTTAEQGLFTLSLPELYERFLVEPLFSPVHRSYLIGPLWLRPSGSLTWRAGQGSSLDSPTKSSPIADVWSALMRAPRCLPWHVRWRPPSSGVRVMPHFYRQTQTKPSMSSPAIKACSSFPINRPRYAKCAACSPRGGRVAIATWQSVDAVPLVRDLQRVAERHLGSYVDYRHSFGDADALNRLLTHGGFSDVRVETVTRAVRLRGGAEVFGRLNTMAVVGMSPAAKHMTDDERTRVTDAITSDSVKAMQEYVDGTDLVFSLGTNVAIARV